MENLRNTLLLLCKDLYYIGRIFKVIANLSIQAMRRSKDGSAEQILLSVSFATYIGWLIEAFPEKAICVARIKKIWHYFDT